jgi:hypothetical protein
MWGRGPAQRKNNNKIKNKIKTIERLKSFNLLSRIVYPMQKEESYWKRPKQFLLSSQCAPPPLTLDSISQALVTGGGGVGLEPTKTTANSAGLISVLGLCSIYYIKLFTFGTVF